eukprot:TRINITY_DN6317_c0_g1_i1.p1 TRINITY_DN6317_c0_g1~~TRINITY_DN6317_c0_g1_i1.p1  ORF type:complete len:478 (+),score=108.79 TRINITY_DN6317_c0_g1_i1:166-1599(+)
MDTTADSAYGQMAAFRDEQNGLAHVRGILDMPSEARSILIKELLSSMPEHEIVDVYNHIRVLLRHDFVDALPAELYSRIFTLLDDRTLARCELVCRSWRDAIRKSRDIWPVMFKMKEDSSRRWQEMLQIAPLLPKPQTSIGWRCAYKTLYQHAQQLKRNWRNGVFQPTEIVCNGQGIYCLQYDTDKIVTGNRDDTIKIWGLHGPYNSPRHSLAGHQGSVLCLQFDDIKVVSASSDCTIRIWSLDNYRCVKVLDQAHTESVLHVRFDAKRMVSCSKDKSIVIWSPKDAQGFDWQIKRKLTGHIAAVNVVEFDDTYIVSASGDRTIQLWDVDTGDHKATLRGHTRGIACLQYRGNAIASGSSDETIRLWDVETRQTRLILNGHEALVRCVRFNENFVVSGSYDQTVRLWDFKTGAALNVLRGHSNRVFRVQFDHMRIISSSQDDKMIIWDFSNGIVAERTLIVDFDEQAQKSLGHVSDV